MLSGGDSGGGVLISDGQTRVFIVSDREGGMVGTGTRWTNRQEEA